MLGASVPFADTNMGGRLKAFGNPGVYWPVACFIFLASIASIASCCAAPRRIPASLRSIAENTNTNGGGGFFIPFVTLLAGYYLNLVPYQLIERCKFVYHGVPALIVGVMFTVFVCDMGLRMSLAPALGKHGASGVWAWVVRHRVGGMRVLLASLFVIVAAGFWYWGMPYAYGFPLTQEQHRARMWVRKWAKNDPFIGLW